jgi:hypothetical protein
MPALDTLDNRYLAGTGFKILINATANKRIFNGACDFYGYRLTAQTTAGSGLKFYDGIDNTGVPILVVTAPVTSQTFKRPCEPASSNPIRCRFGLYVELLGTGQNIDVMVGD